MKNTLRAVLILAGSAVSHGLWAADSQVYSLEIERAPLKTALIKLSKQTGNRLAFLIPSNAQAELLVGPIRGRFTLEAALRVMSEHAGVDFVFANEVTIAVTAADPQDLPTAGATEPASAAGANPVARSAVQRNGAPQSSPGVVEEIVVTAQKREERLQNVPMSISVLQGYELDRLSFAGMAGALNRATGVVLIAPIQGGAAQLMFRGVSAGGAFFNGSSPIAYYLDSVPFGLVKTAVIPDSDLYDLERIEILRGPQGTLYGASAQNGVVRVLTRDPNLDAFEAKARATLSATEHGGGNYRGDMILNVPIVEGRLATRMVASYENLSGWIDKPTRSDVNDAELRNLRLKTSMSPTDELSVGLSAWLSRSDYGAASIANGRRARTSSVREPIAAQYDAYALKIGYETSSYSLTSNTSYLDYRYDAALDLHPFVGAPAVLSSGLTSRVSSEELIVNSLREGAWRWSAGAMFRDAQDRLIQLSPFLPLPIDFSDQSRSMAVFGELTRRFWSGKWALTAGVRYFEDQVSHRENVPQSGNPTDSLLPRDQSTFNATSPRVVLAWHPATDVMMYASYSQGFRSGFTQNANVIRVAPEYPRVSADTLTNYELGAKVTAASGRLSFDAAVYYVDWQDVQQTLTVEFAEVPVSVLVNGESASGIGLEFAAMVRPLDGLELGANFSWNDLRVDSSLVSAGLPLYKAGDRLNFSSEYTAGVSAEYAFAFDRGYEARLSFSADYFSRQSYRNALESTVIVDVGHSQTLARASVSIDSPEHWGATLFVENLNNESAPGVGLYHVAEWSPRARPRTAGVRLEYRF